MHERGERRRPKGRVDQDAAIVLLESWLMKLDADRRRAGEAP
jgi:RNase H-fold protein (predicted Holliday junction resolvase)